MTLTYYECLGWFWAEPFLFRPPNRWKNHFLIPVLGLTLVQGLIHNGSGVWRWWFGGAALPPKGVWTSLWGSVGYFRSIKTFSNQFAWKILILGFVSTRLVVLQPPPKSPLPRGCATRSKRLRDLRTPFFLVLGSRYVRPAIQYAEGSRNAYFRFCFACKLWSQMLGTVGKWQIRWCWQLHGQIWLSRDLWCLRYGTFQNTVQNGLLEIIA